jgi:farnesyl diphosphate synthase
LDCYGDPAVIGKIGTDIVEGKCSWLIVQSLQHPDLTQDMRDQLAKHYGRKDSQSENIVKDIYKKLDLQSRYQTFEIASEERITGLIRDFSKIQPQLGLVLSSFSSRIFGRKK